MMNDSSPARGQTDEEQASGRDDVDMVDARTFDDDEDGAPVDDRAPLASRIRMILLLSLLSWGLVALAIAAIMGRL